MTTGDPSLVERLYQARRTGGPVDVRGAVGDLDDALALQLAVADRFAADGVAIGGWKIGMTSGRARDSLGPGVRPFGFVCADRVLASGAEVALGAIRTCEIEPELCLLLGADLRGADVDRGAARAAVSGIAAAFEINEMRAPRDGEGAGLGLVADGLAHWGIVVGEPVPVPEDLTTGVDLWRDDELVGTYRSDDPAILRDDPLVSLARLAAELDKHGRGLTAGQAVITGSMTRVRPEGPGTWRADFGEAGAVVLNLR